MACPDRGSPKDLRAPRRAPDGAIRVGRRQSPPPENGARGGARRSAEFHRDKNRGDCQRPGMANDAGAPLERRRRAGDSSLRGDDAQAPSEGVARVLFRLRDLSGRGSERGGEDRLSQGLTKKPIQDLGSVLFGSSHRPPKKEKPCRSENFFWRKKKSQNRGNNYCPASSSF